MIRIDIKRTDFYNEFTKEEQKRFFFQEAQKFLPAIDNIYYTISIKGDFSDNPKIKDLFSVISHIKDISQQTHEVMPFRNDLFVDFKSFKIYKYCLSAPDLYDVFLLDYLPNSETPRILVQIRSYGLWIHGHEKMLNDSFENVKKVLAEYNCEVLKCVENRIDYCYHTNAIKEPEKIFSDRVVCNSMKTTMTRYHVTGRIVKENDKSVLLKDYFALGERKSNFVFIRFYNKVLEVIEKGYKAYFFEIWFKNGLISFYDKFCFEYAYKDRNYNHIHMAKLEFYVLYGKDNKVRLEFKSALENKSLSSKDYKALADSYMPDLTKILNCEFETKRKFYYLSDNFIEGILKVGESTKVSDTSLNRIFKIIDNRLLFLDYLTDSTLKFTKSDGNYVDWWFRLRRLKLDCNKLDSKLIREYSNTIDLDLVKKRFINNVATNAVYLNKDKSNDSGNSGFLEDITDILSNLNDNDKYNIILSCYDEVGELSKNFNSDLLENYQIKKAAKEKQTLNRKTFVTDKQSESIIIYLD